MTRKTKYIIFILNFVLIFSFIMIPVLAKYYRNKVNNIGIAASEFYFTSDLLAVPATNGSYPEYVNAKRSNAITFYFNNYEDDLRITTVDIEYKVVIKNSNDVVVFEKEYILPASSTKQSKEFTIDTLSIDTYTVEVTSNLPYKKVLKAKFIMQDINNDITYTVSDGVGSTIVMLTISVEDYSGNINIKWPSNVFPDNSDPLLENAIDCDSYKVYFNSYSEYTFIFFKSDSGLVYNNADFEISK